MVLYSPPPTGNLLKLGSYAAEETREEWAWCRQLDGGDQTPVAWCVRDGWPEGPTSKDSESLWWFPAPSGAFTLELPFCSHAAIPNPSLIEATHAQPPDCWPDGGEANDSSGQPATITTFCSSPAVSQLLTREPPGCLGMESRPLT